MKWCSAANMQSNNSLRWCAQSRLATPIISFQLNQMKQSNAHYDLCCHLLNPITGHKWTLNINWGGKRETHSPRLATVRLRRSIENGNEWDEWADERKNATKIAELSRLCEFAALFTRCARAHYTHLAKSFNVCCNAESKMFNRNYRDDSSSWCRSAFDVSAAHLKAMKLIIIALIYVLMAWSRQQRFFSPLLDSIQRMKKRPMKRLFNRNS